MIAWIAATRRIVVPFAPVQLAVAAGAAAEPVNAADEPAAPRAEKEPAAGAIAVAAISAGWTTSTRRLAAAARLATGSTSANIAAPGAANRAWSSALANRRPAFPAAVPRVAGELAAIHGATVAAAARRFARARRLAAATHFTATISARAAGIATTEREHAAKINGAAG